MTELNTDKLAAYIRSIEGFVYSEQIDSYDHMGAVVVDGILQAGLSYKTVVKPRVMSILNQYGDKKTTDDFISVCAKVGIRNLINFQNGYKPDCIISLLHFLKSNNIQTVRELKLWLRNPDNKNRFIKENKGIGAKTAEYFRILCGDQTVKVDVHMARFLDSAGFANLPLDEAVKLVSNTALKLGVKPSVLDYSIWNYQSNLKTLAR